MSIKYEDTHAKIWGGIKVFQGTVLSTAIIFLVLIWVVKQYFFASAGHIPLVNTSAQGVRLRLQNALKVEGKPGKYTVVFHQGQWQESTPEWIIMYTNNGKQMAHSAT